MYNKDDYDMKEARKRYNAMLPVALLRSSRMNEPECAKRVLYSPAEVLHLIENGYRGKMFAGEWMDGIAMGLTCIPVFMVQPAGECVFSANVDTWAVAKEWMDLDNMPVITRICDRIVEYNYEIAYEF